MEDSFDIGLFGLDMLGGNLARCLAEHDISVVVSAEPGLAVHSEVEFSARGIPIVSDLSQLFGLLKPPRTVLLRVAPGRAMQDAFAEALDLAETGDVIIDASDSWFKDTSLRARAAASKNVHFVTLGLAESEAACCPLLMAGGRPEAYDRVRPKLEAAAARHGGSRCVGYLGGGPAGQFIKMTHTAVENAIAEIVRETRAMLERSLGAEAGDLLRARREDPLCQYLLSPAVAPASDSDRELARWAAQAACDLEIPVLALEAASGARSWENREALAEPFCQPFGIPRQDGESLVTAAHGALCAAIIIAYTEGLALMATASERLGFHIDISETVRVWRGGVNLRGRLLEDIQAAFQATPGLPNLLFDDDFSEKVMELQEFLRQAVWQADEWNISTPALAASLRYIDTFRDAWLPINLVQPDDFHFTPRPRRAYAAAPTVLEWEDDDQPATDQSLA